MADANPQAILAAVPTQQTNPLAMVSQWQDLANKITENKAMQQNIANSQLQNRIASQGLATKMAQRNAQILTSLSNMSDAQLQGGKPLYDALNAEVASGQIDPKSAAVYKSQIDAVTASGGAQNGAAYRPFLNSMLMSTMAPSEVVAAGTPHLGMTDIGGQLVPTEAPSALSLMQNPNQTITQMGPGFGKTIGPQYVNTGNTLMPVGGNYGAPAVAEGMSPADANQIVSFRDPNTGQIVTGPRWQFGGVAGGAPPVAGGVGGTGAPAASGLPQAPAGGWRLPGAGATEAPQGEGPMGTGKTGTGGLFNAGPTETNPQALEAQESNFKDYRTAMNAMPNLKTQEQTLVRMNEELSSVTTGPGTNDVQTVRNVLSTLNGLLGGKINPNDIAAGNYDELQKDMNQLVSQSGDPRLRSAMEAVVHGNPSMLLNRLANSNVVGILIGNNRRAQMEYLMTKDKVSGRDFQQAKMNAAGLDPEALALDVISKNPAMMQRLRVELKNNPAQFANFKRSVLLARHYGLYNYGPGGATTSGGPVVSIAPPNAMQGVGNALQ